MSSSIKNLYQFRTTSKITQAQGAASTFTVGNDIFTDTAVSITAGSIQLTNRTGSIVELFTVTVAAGVATIATRGIKPDGTTDAIYQYERPKNTLCTLTVLENQIFDKGGSETLTGNLTYSGNVIYTKSAKFPVYADATARDAGIPSPANGMMIYNTALGVNQQYIGGSWVNVDTGTATGNATEGAVGLGELGTTAEVTDGTATGGAGPLILTPDKASAQIQSGTWIYGADAGGDDTYVVALTPTLTVYTTGQSLYAKVTTTNTGACSFDFGPGAKNVKTLDGNDPVSGMVQGVVHLIYDGTNLILQNPAFVNGGFLATVGENVTAGQFLRPGITSGGGNITQSTGGGGTTADYRVGYDNTNQYVGQSFLVSTPGVLTQISVRLSKASSPTGNLTMKLYSDTGTTLVATSSNTIAESGLTGSATQQNFTFSNYVLATGTYYYRLETSRANDATNYTIIDNAGSNIYANGIPYDINSTNTRSATGIGYDHRFTITIGATGDVVGKMYLTDANFPLWTNCIGVARNTASADGIIMVDIQYNKSQSGLTAGTTYYLSDTAGAISTSAGTNSKIIGKAISTTEILINPFGA